MPEDARGAGPAIPVSTPIATTTRDEAADPSVVAAPDQELPEPGIALCLSGGGSRAMLFHGGAILRLAETGLLGQLSLVSGVSGGSITAGQLACYLARGGTSDRDRILDGLIGPLVRISGKFVDIPAFLAGSITPGGSPGRRFAGALAQHLYGPMTLGDLPATPEFVFNATNLGTGALWRFSREFVGDYLVGGGRRAEVRLAEAVAASCAFPPFFAPMRMSFPDTGWSVSGDLGTPEYRKRVDLGDGGIYDNLGLERAWKNFATVLISDGGGSYKSTPKPPTDPLRLSIRVTQTIDHQVRALRRRQIMAGFSAEPRVREGAFWAIGTRIADYEVDELIKVDQLVANRLAAIGTHMRGMPSADARRLVNWGYAIADAALRRYVLQAPAPNPQLPFPKYPLG